MDRKQRINLDRPFSLCFYFFFLEDLKARNTYETVRLYSIIARVIIPRTLRFLGVIGADEPARALEYVPRAR